MSVIDTTDEPTADSARCVLGANTPLAQARAGLDACVHCGFCLQACPTYLALGDENESPRGRLVLMRALVDGSLLTSDPAVGTHIDRCLGCRACETACPSGVPYGRLLEATRATIAADRPIPPIARLILRVFATPWLLRPALVLSRLARATGIPALFARLPGRLGFASAMLATSTPPIAERSYAPVRAAPPRGRVALLEGCVMDGLFAPTNRAAERTLTVNGYTIVQVRGQGCCGALHAHAGDLQTARALARRNVAAFEAAFQESGVEAIAVTAAGCGAMLKEYGHLLHDEPGWASRADAVSARSRDITELLADAGPVRGAAIPGLVGPVTYDAPCHLQHAQRLTAPPLAVLGAIPGLPLVPLTDSDQCCGSAGIYNLVEPDLSDAVLRPKLARIGETGAALVATGNPGCMMQIGAGLRRVKHTGRAAAVMHPVSLLDASYAAAADQRAATGATGAAGTSRGVPSGGR
jgi:glycolate oxidase iron-sulfur subunit